MRVPLHVSTLHIHASLDTCVCLYMSPLYTFMPHLTHAYASTFNICMPQVSVPNNANTQDCTTAQWIRDSGTLTFKICQDVPPLQASVNVSVVLRNPSSAQAAPATVVMSMTSGSSVLINQPVSGSVLQAKGSPQFRDVKATEITTVVSQLNPVSIAFSPNIPISQGANLTIHNLVNFKQRIAACTAATTTPTTVSLPAVEVLFKEESGQAPLRVQSIERSVTVQWMKDAAGLDYCGHVSSALTVKLPRFYAQWSNVNVTVHLINDDFARPGGKPSVSISGCRAGILLSGKHYCPYKMYTARSFAFTQGCTAEQQLTPANLQPVIPGEAP
jgi:hypothetical protein